MTINSSYIRRKVTMLGLQRNGPYKFYEWTELEFSQSNFNQEITLAGHQG